MTSHGYWSQHCALKTCMKFLAFNQASFSYLFSSDWLQLQMGKKRLLIHLHLGSSEQ